MNKLSRSVFVIGTLMCGGFIISRSLSKIPIKEYTADCLYLAVMDDEIVRNELDGNTIDDKKIVLPPRIETLQYKYHLFLAMNKKLTRREMNAEIKKTEVRLEESKQYIGQPKTELKIGLY